MINLSLVRATAAKWRMTNFDHVCIMNYSDVSKAGSSQPAAGKNQLDVLGIEMFDENGQWSYLLIK